MADVPLRDAAQALLDATAHSLYEGNRCPICGVRDGHDEGACAWDRLRAALAAADTAPAADGPVLPLALTEADAHNLGRVMTVCEGCRKGHYSLAGKVTNYPCAHADCGCWFCHGPQVTPAQAVAAGLAAADGTTPTQPDEVLWTGALSLMRRLVITDVDWEWEVDDSYPTPQWIRTDRDSRSWEIFGPLSDAEQAAWRVVATPATEQT